MNYNEEKYIKVSDLKEKYKWWCDTPSGQQEYKEICDCVDAIPAADVQEVIHAHWIKNEDGYYECSNCGSTKPHDGTGGYKPEWLTYWECPYCRYCGAKMDGKDGKNNVACI